MRDCADVEVRDLLPDLLHERLVEGERERVLAHVDSCVDCTDELSLLRATAAASTAGAPRVDADLIARQVLARLRATPASPAAPTLTVAGAPRTVVRTAYRPAWSRATLRAAAAALLMVAGSGIVLYERGRTAVDVAGAAPGATDESATLVGEPPRTVAAGAPVAAAVGDTVTSPPTRAASHPAGQSALGASFDDLSDDELAAVLDAVEARDRGPAAEPAPTPAIVTSGEVL